jgi:hypothetical protein
MAPRCSRSGQDVVTALRWDVGAGLLSQVVVCMTDLVCGLAWGSSRGTRPDVGFPCIREEKVFTTFMDTGTRVVRVALSHEAGGVSGNCSAGAP